MSVSEYKTLSSSNPATLIRDVKTHMADGWQPLSGHVSGSFLTGAQVSQVMVKGSGTSYTDYNLLYSASATVLNALVTEAIGDGWDVLPGGVGSGMVNSLLCQPMVKGTGVVPGEGLQPDNNLSDVQNKTVALSTLGGARKADVDGLSRFSDLRTREPAYEGERVYIKCHTPPAINVFLPEGGGWFIGRLTAQADDGGYVASSGDAWHWERDKAIEELTIADFGGVADGITDCQPAFQANYTFMFGPYARARTGGTQQGTGGYSPYIRIKYNAGNYYQTPGQYNKSGVKIANGSADLAFNPSGYAAAGGISIEGAEIKSGKHVCTWFTSDKSNNPVFLLNHRRCNFKGLGFNGQQTTAVNQYNASSNPTGTNRLVGATMGVWNDTASNKQQFIYNECPGGCYLRIQCCSYQNIGGDMFFVKDTLDTKIDQIFGSGNAAPVFTTSWSGQTVGVWDHSTSVEIRNCNFGTCAAPAIRAPRCTQSLMSNVWAEHGSTPFDLNNGQWDMNMVCIEDCRADMCLWNAKFSIRTLSTPTGNDFSTAAPSSGNYTGFTTNPDGSAVTSWAESYGQGDYLLMNYGAYFDCPVRVKVGVGCLTGANNQDADVWVNLGAFSTSTVTGAPNGSSWRVRINGSRYYNTSSTASMLSDELGGCAVINIGRGTGSTPKISWYNEGSGPIREVQYKSQQFNTAIPEVWVRIKGRVGEWAAFVEQTGYTRREAGVPAIFTPSGTVSATSPGLNIVEGRASFHNQQAGIGFRGDMIEEVSRIVAATGVTETEPVYTNIVRWEAKMINGQVLATPVYAFKPLFTTSNPATATVTTGGTLTLTTAVNYAVSQQWQFSSDNGTTWTNVSGATGVVLTKANVTAADAGQYRLAVRSNNGSGGAGITSYGPVTTVTVN
ncbi:MAG: EPS-depolymerase [Siphoviridae sp. ctdc_1]|nr:MAG: EPS-depolymerase [Siphoviridae sp. ctdc_1]